MTAENGTQPAPREDLRFRVLRLLREEPDLSQREIAHRLGTSLGATNYCLRALIEAGQIKVRNFRASDRKLRYAYVLTPAGLRAKAQLASAFLARKRAEYAALQREIAAVQAELDAEAGS